MSETPQEAAEIEESDEEKRILVVDPDDYRQTQQIKQIHQAKREYAEVKTDPEAEMIEYVRHVQNLIHELEPVMMRIDTDTDYLNEYELGTLRMADEDLHVEYDSDQDELLSTKEEAIEYARDQGYVYDRTLEGLNSLLGIPGFYGVERSSGPFYYSPKYIEAKFRYWPTPITDSAYRACRKFIAEAGLGLEFGKDKGPAEI